MPTKNQKKVAVLTIVFFLNIGVALAKIVVGTVGGLLNLVADGIHSIGDSASNIVGVYGIKLANRPPDEKYPYGYSKFETVATIIVGAGLLAAAAEIVHSAWERFFRPVPTEIGLIPFVVVLATIAINLFTFLYERRRARELTSEFLRVDAGHTLSDVFVSLSVLAGLFLIKIGYVLADPIVSCIIVFFILKLFYSNMRGAAEILCDSNQIPREVIDGIALSVGEVRLCHAIRSRGRADAVFVDLHIGVDPSLSLARAHEISHEVEARLREECPQIIGVSVHIEPIRE